ncbi:MAG: hypothetical protein GX621_04455 [Pirellulaceae bacterium]|nr:hypothetical protein [Pirellulaceae bacterium]
MSYSNQLTLWILPCAAAVSCLVAGCADSGAAADRAVADRALPKKFRSLLPLHTPLGKPKPGDWLAEHEEHGQTYSQYLRANPVRPDSKLRTIYIQPLGDYNPTQQKTLDLTIEFMEIYFGLPVTAREAVSLDVLPDEARRKHPQSGTDQISSTWIIFQVLPPRLPSDGVAILALTTSDLWPGKGWNFVYGQASLVHRTGVLSIHRNGDPTENDAAFRLCLRRTLQTATHETGHMLSMSHCTRFECNMCGSNHREESDRRPLALCPHCLAKLCHATKVDPAARFEKLAAFCETNGLKKEAEFYRKSLDVVAPARQSRR